MVGFGHLGAPPDGSCWVRSTSAVRAYDPFAPRALTESYGVVFTELDDVFECDIVFVLVPLTPATERMIGAVQLALLRPGSVFVNVSRGKVVDSAALLARLQRGDVTACLDVFDPEPLPPGLTDRRPAERIPEPAHRRSDRGESPALLQADGRRVSPPLEGLEPLAELTPENARLTPAPSS